MHHQPSTSLTAQTWWALTVLAITPAVTLSLALVLAFLGMKWPALWIHENIFDGPLALPGLWLCTIGGPLFAIIMGLTLEAWHERTRFVARVSGVFAWILLVLGCFSWLPAVLIIMVE